MKFDRRLLRGTLFAASAAVLVSGGIARPQAASAAPKGWSLPAGAREVAPDVFELTSRDAHGNAVSGYAILHYAKGHEAKGGKPGGGGGTTSSGYAFIASGFKWKGEPESYVVDPSIADGHGDETMTDGYVRGVVAGAIAKWEDAAGNGVLGDGVSTDVFGGEVAGTVDRTKLGNATNDVNEVCFDAISQPGVIAVTFVWGISYGPPGGRRITEWDQIYNDADFTWSDVGTSGDLGDMDFDNIACHEIGHAFGMDHPSLTYSNETMHRYASNGETNKRTLESGDIAGINLLY